LILYETIVVLLITFVPLLLAPFLPSIAGLLELIALSFPIIYLFAEKVARHRLWRELGITRHGFVIDCVANWRLVLVVVIALQLIPVTLYYLFLPDALSHTSGRVPEFNNLGILIPLILVLTLREELVFRGLFQERFSWFIGQLPAIVGVSVLFALSHLSSGVPVIVGIDVGFVFLDSVVYGLIFSRSRNVFVAWAAHAAADIVGLALLLSASMTIA
jgi:membrane protease YdiL (CAAX protease family)